MSAFRSDVGGECSRHPVRDRLGHRRGGTARLPSRPCTGKSGVSEPPGPALPPSGKAARPAPILSAASHILAGTLPDPARFHRAGHEKIAPARGAPLSSRVCGCPRGQCRARGMSGLRPERVTRRRRGSHANRRGSARTEGGRRGPAPLVASFLQAARRSLSSGGAGSPANSSLPDGGSSSCGDPSSTSAGSSRSASHFARWAAATLATPPREV